MRSIIVLVIIGLSAVSVKSYIARPGPRYIATKGYIWPRPQFQNMFDDYYILTPKTFKYVSTGATCNLLDNAFQRYFKILQKNTVHEVDQQSSEKSNEILFEGNYLGELDHLTVNLNGSCDDTAYPSIDMDEAYVLNVTGKQANLAASSIWGILRGLESFSQLVYVGFDSASNLQIRINATYVVDYPRFKHRGLLLDTARHYIPVEQIYQIIDGLAYNKMNVFHWHIDTVSITSTKSNNYRTMMAIMKTLFCLSALLACSSARRKDPNPSDVYQPPHNPGVYPPGAYPPGTFPPGAYPPGPNPFEDKRVFLVTLNKNVRDPWSAISNMFPPQGPYQQHAPQVGDGGHGGVGYPQYGGF